MPTKQVSLEDQLNKAESPIDDVTSIISIIGIGIVFAATIAFFSSRRFKDK